MTRKLETDKTIIQVLAEGPAWVEVLVIDKLKDTTMIFTIPKVDGEERKADMVGIWM